MVFKNCVTLRYIQLTDHFSRDLFSRDHYFRDNFSGYFFPGDHFSETIVSETVFPGTFFQGTIISGTIFPGIFFLEIFLFVDLFSRGPFFWVFFSRGLFFGDNCYGDGFSGDLSFACQKLYIFLNDTPKIRCFCSSNCKNYLRALKPVHLIKCSFYLYAPLIIYLTTN